jgi:hypothetical protein
MIWHDFMNVAHGSYCDDFPQPTTPFQAVPFYGKYSKEGGPADPSVPYNVPGTTQTGKDKTKKGKSNGGTGTKSYDPRLYEAPPQPAPQTTPPAGGNGTGTGNAPSGTTGGGAAPPGTVGQTQG